MQKSVGSRGSASFALVSDEAGTTDAGIELVLGDGGCASVRVWMKTPYARFWRLWSPRNAEFPGGQLA